MFLSKDLPSPTRHYIVVAARPDLLPPEYLAALATLQDRLPPFPSDTARQLIEAELGRPISQVYSELTPEPVAAASLGQVLKDDFWDKLVEVVHANACLVPRLLQI